MDYQTFKAEFDDDAIQTVTYRNKAGEIVTARLSSDATPPSLGSRDHYVYVNNFTLVPLADVIAVKTTEQTW